MEIELQAQDNVTIVSCKGEIIGDARLKLSNELNKLGCVDTILDLEEVSMMDAVGLGMLTNHFARLEKDGKKLVFGFSFPQCQVSAGCY